MLQAYRRRLIPVECRRTALPRRTPYRATGGPGARGGPAAPPHVSVFSKNLYIGGVGGAVGDGTYAS
jgi:hypothetical protein